MAVTARALAPVAVAAGGLLLVASFTQPWTSSGLASSLSGRALADLLLRGTVGRFVPRWAGLGLYLLPVGGGLLLLGTGLGGRVGRRLAWVGVAVAAVAGVLVAGALGWRPITRLSAAIALVVAGLVLAAGGLLAERRVRPDDAAAPGPGRDEGRSPQG